MDKVSTNSSLGLIKAFVSPDSDTLQVSLSKDRILIISIVTMNAIWKFRNKVMLTSEPINPGSLTQQFQLDYQWFKGHLRLKIWDSKQTLRLLQWERPPCSWWKQMPNGNAFLVTCKTYITIEW